MPDKNRVFLLFFSRLKDVTFESVILQKSEIRNTLKIGGGN